MDGRLGEHGVVLELRLAQRGAVTSNQNELGYKYITSAKGETFSAFTLQPPRERTDAAELTFARTHLLESGLVSQGVFARLDDEGKTSRDGL